MSMKIANIRLNCLTKEHVFNYDNNTKAVFTINAQFIDLAHKNPRFLSILNNNFTTIDSQVIYYYLRLKYPDRVIEKIAGSDVVYDFLDFGLKNDYKIFFLGGSELSNKGALENVHNQYPNICAEGYSPPYSNYPFDPNISKDIMDRIYSYKPHILFVGFGAPKQEYWIDDNYINLNNAGVRWVVGCGGTLDFLSGKMSRAPRFFQLICAEGLYRALKEPSLYRTKRILESLRGLFYMFSQKN